MNRQTQLLQLFEDVRGCAECPRMGGRGGVIARTGLRVQRPIMFVAEAPGRRGALRTGVPLFGDATGNNFEYLLAAVGLSRRDVWVTNAVMCWPAGVDGNNDRPTTQEIETCAQYLDRQLELVRPEIVVPMGATALSALGRLDPTPKGRLRDLVGSVFVWRNRLLSPMYHPSPRVVNTVRPLSEQVRDLRFIRSLVADPSDTSKGSSSGLFDFAKHPVTHRDPAVALKMA